jgi:nitrate reductase alpha subunit
MIYTDIFNNFLQRELLKIDKSPLYPWVLLEKEQSFYANHKWLNVTSDNLYVFAKRIDNDDMLCLIEENGVCGDKIISIHGWTNEGFSICNEYVNVWDWVKSAINDISEF